jgi:hypothetical protein
LLTSCCIFVGPIPHYFLNLPTFERFDKLFSYYLYDIDRTVSIRV